MKKGLQKLMKYSLAELESYATTSGTCIKKINTNLHVSLGPYCLKNIKKALLLHLGRKKIGFYDVQLNGIILDIKNIKILSNFANIRAEDPQIHVKINADCYIFCPVIDAVLTGTVKHIGSHNVGVILYRVFNANIRFKDKLNYELEIDQQVQFCVKNFDLQNIFPYIDGDRLIVDGSNAKKNFIKFKHEGTPNKSIKFTDEDTEEQLGSKLPIKQEVSSEEED